MKIKIFTSIHCSWCDKLKTYLKSKKKRYEEIIINKDEKGRAEMINKTEQFTIPVTIIERKNKEFVVVGYDVKKLKEALS